MAADTVLIATLCATGLETALNAAARLDPETLERLAQLAGKTIAVTAEGLEWTLYFQPDRTGVQVQTSCAVIPDVELRGTPLALIQSWRMPDRATEIQVTGDAALARQFQTALARLDIDWEEQIAHRLGDPLAHQLGRWARGARAWGQHTVDAVQRASSDTVHYELNLLPPQWEMEQFLSAVDTLRDDTDRLQARLERVRRLIGDPPG